MQAMLEADLIRTPCRHRLEASRPEGAVDITRFRAGMRALAGAVCVLTTGQGDARCGLTATAVCSLSGEPPRLIACVNQRGATYAAIRENGRIGVNVLCSGHVAVAERFAGMDGSCDDRFACGEWAQGRHGVPVLLGACCSFQCALAEIIDAVSHGILICDILDVAVERDAKPLLYADGRFAVLHEPMIDPRYALQF